MTVCAGSRRVRRSDKASTLASAEVTRRGTMHPVRLARWLRGSLDGVYGQGPTVHRCRDPRRLGPDPSTCQTSGTDPLAATLGIDLRSQSRSRPKAQRITPGPTGEDVHTNFGRARSGCGGRKYQPVTPACWRPSGRRAGSIRCTCGDLPRPGERVNTRCAAAPGAPVNRRVRPACPAERTWFSVTNKRTQAGP